MKEKKNATANSGTLNLKQFKVLTFMEKNKKHIAQRELAAIIHLSVGSINATISELKELGLLDADGITAAGLLALEPYRVKRAIFIAAGFGSRLVPVTLNTPKPLVRVNGVRMIDTLLDAVIAAGIEEIYVVRGYLGEQFDQLLYKYPMIQFLENPIYNESNNISSALAARHLMCNAYVLEADLVLYNPELITKYQYTSNYLGVPVDVTDDWCLYTQKRVITKVSVGGTNCHHMFGISYWNEADGRQLCEDIAAVFHMPGGKERYWDLVALQYFQDHYRVEVRECNFDDIVEIDSYSDLKTIDSAYR